MPAPQSPASQRQNERFESGALMLQDRKDGLTVEQIAAKHEVGRATVYRRIWATLHKQAAPIVEAFREQEAIKLDEIEEGYRGQLAIAAELASKAADDEDLMGVVQAAGIRQKAWDGLLRTSDRRSKLMGLDAPVKVDATVTVYEGADVELAAMLERVSG